MMMQSFGKRVDIPGGHRKEHRERVALAASATTLAGSRAVAISDLGRSGAKLSGRTLPQDGTQVLLKVGDIELLGDMIWRGEHDCGMTFDEPLTDEQLAQIKEQGRLGTVYMIV
jgi:hypothetical protein